MHTAYSAAKFAVKGFTEALLGEMRQLAPHCKVGLVMPGRAFPCPLASPFLSSPLSCCTHVGWGVCCAQTSRPTSG